MNSAALESGPSNRRASAESYKVAPPVFMHLGGGSITGHDPKYLAVCPREQSCLCASKPRRVLDKGFEHGPEIKRRAADDLQNIGCGSLMFQGFCQVARPRLHFFEQPCVLYSDDRLVSKGIDELNLAFAEWAHFGAPNDDHPNCLACVDQRSGEHGAITMLDRIRPVLGVLICFC